MACNKDQIYDKNTIILGETVAHPCLSHEILNVSRHGRTSLMVLRDVIGVAGTPVCMEELRSFNIWLNLNA